MEIVEWETENKPEFDGKFFVKIFKDEVLEEKEKVVAICRLLAVFRKNFY